MASITAQGAAARPVRWTLRRKGIAGFVVVAAYLVLMAALISNYRVQLFVLIERLEQLHGVEEALTRVKTSVAHAILVVSEAYSAGEPLQNEPILLDLEAIQSGLAGLRPSYPVVGGTIAALITAADDLRKRGDRSTLLDLRSAFHGLVADLDMIERDLAGRKEKLNREYRDAYQRTAWSGTVLGLAGIILLGVVVAVFFSRLALDLRALRERAVQILAGYRGEALSIDRADEVGELAQAINRMQTGLREREQQLEIARQARFHHEKMAAVGSLAAAIAHEINNPITAIQGVAEVITAQCQSAQCAQFNQICEPRLILEQTRRIAGITRQLSNITVPQSATAELLDLNTLVRNTGNLISYDKRLRGIVVRYELDREIPAVVGVPDHLTQILINLLLNAADALAGVADREREIVVATHNAEASVRLAVTDNGCGMAPEVLARAFEESFTTKPPGHGSGIGLFMCKALIDTGGGAIHLASTPDVGTTVTVSVPVVAAPAAANPASQPNPVQTTCIS